MYALNSNLEIESVDVSATIIYDTVADFYCIRVRLGIRTFLGRQDCIVGLGRSCLMEAGRTRIRLNCQYGR